MDYSEYLPLAEVCRLVGGVSKNTVRRWIKTWGFPKPITISYRTVVYKRAEVLAWVESHRQKGGAR